MSLKEWCSGQVFNFVHSNNLVYNTCWEDPRLDRQALRFGPDDTVLAITSAGCNVLDYVLAGVQHVYAVDLNPRQNALLELKMAAIRGLEYDQFFEMFGRGTLRDASRIYYERLRAVLSPWAKRYWDRRIRFFENQSRTFYFRGSTGVFARMINFYVDHVCRVRPQIERMLTAATLEEQQRIYYDEVAHRFWSRLLKFAMDRDTTLSLVGVPQAQRRQVEKQYAGGIVQFVQDCVEAVFAKLPLRDNYFWRVYLTGGYSADCCPEYVSRRGFELLKGGLLDRVTIYTGSVCDFLRTFDEPISRWVLLDHMDWMSDRCFPVLEWQWQAILDRSSSRTRMIWRSGGLRTDYLDRIQVLRGRQSYFLDEVLVYDHQLANELHARDRVHTYGSFYIADIAS